MAMLHDLIRKSKTEVPSRRERYNFRAAYGEELATGAVHSPRWCQVSLELLDSLYYHINSLSPIYQSDRIEKIMWEHDIKVAIKKTVIQRKIIEDSRRPSFWDVLDIVGNALQGNLPTAGPADLLKSYMVPEELAKAIKNIDAETKRKLRNIGVYHWPE